MKDVLKRLASTFALVSMLLMVFVMVQAPTLPTPGRPASPTPERLGSPTPGLPGPYVDQHWWHIITSPDEQVSALLTHDVDAGSVPRLTDLPVLEDASFTITKMEMIGYTFLMENNRRWPFGTPCGGNKDPGGIEDPLNAENWRAVYFRKGVGRLIDKTRCAAIYDPLKSRAHWWLPPCMPAWINPNYSLPTFDPWESAVMFDAGGFLQGTTPNPAYDPDWHPASAEYLRIDPLTGEDLEPIEYYTIGPTESPLGFEMATLITSWMRKMGLQVNLVAGTWLGMITRLINPLLEDYQFMTGIGIEWGTTAPHVLYDFTYSENLPLWCFSLCNYTELDYWALKMKTTLDIEECKAAAFKVQEYLNEYEPYYPMLLCNTYMAWTGPWPETQPPYTNPGFIGIVNSEGGIDRFGEYQLYLDGCEANFNFWTEMRGHANRTHPETGVEINKWAMPTDLTSLNPMEADTASDWDVLSMVEDGLIRLNPYTHAYEPWGATKQCVDDIVMGKNIKPWVGPGRFQAGGNEVYDGTYDNGPDGIMGTDDDTYEGIPVADVTADNLTGDDQLGLVTTWTLRDDLHWHDSDPGPDMEFGTADDGVVHPATTADVLFVWEMMINQQNDRYREKWWYVWDVEPIDAYTFKIYEEWRYIFAFEGHSDVALLAPKHIWEPWVGPVMEPISGIKTIQKWTDWANNEHQWTGWEEAYMEDPQYPGQMLTKLIGFGPYIYHLGGWEPGVSVHLEANRLYFGGRICSADANLDRLVDVSDLWWVADAYGSTPGDPNWNPRADICLPSQVILGWEIYPCLEQFGLEWGPGIPPCDPASESLTTLLPLHIQNCEVAMASGTRVYIDPPNIVDPLLVVGENFTVNIMVDNVTDLWQYQFELSFNPDVIQGVWYDEPWYPVEPGPFLESEGGTAFPIGGNWDNTLGELWLTGAFLFEKDPAYCPDGGPGVLATVTFEVVGLGDTELRFTDRTGLLDATGWIILGRENVEDGYFRNIDSALIPTASFTITPVDTPEPLEGYNTTFTSTSTAVPPKTITTYKWLFWARKRAYFWARPRRYASIVTSLDAVTYNYTRRGTWNVTLTVIDNAGVVATTTLDAIIYTHDVFFTGIVTNATMGKYPAVLHADIGEIVEVNVTAINQGDFTETFNVTCFWRDFYQGEWHFGLIGAGTHYDITLAPGATTTLTFYWDTEGRNLTHPRAFRIHANASAVPYEFDKERDVGKIADNEFIGPPNPIRVKFHDIRVEVATVKYVTPEEIVKVTVMNDGDFEETSISVNAYIDNDLVLNESIDFIENKSYGDYPRPTTWKKIFTYYWNTTGLTPGLYTIKANATLAEDDYEPYDNTDIVRVVTIGFYDVAVTKIRTHPTSASPGDLIYIDVTVENQGDLVDTLNVTVYARRHLTSEEIPVGTQTVHDLLLGASKILNFVWDTTGAPYGNYDIIAEAILPEDADPEDNTYIAFRYIGGIYAPWQEPQGNMFAYLVPLASAIFFMVILGMAAIGFFKILMSVRLRWPLRSMKSEP